MDERKKPGGSEFIREGAGTFDRDSSFVPASSRMNSLPQVQRRGHTQARPKARQKVAPERTASSNFDGDKIDVSGRTQQPGGSEFIREGAGTFDRDSFFVPASSRMNSLPQVQRRGHIQARPKARLKWLLKGLRRATQSNASSCAIRSLNRSTFSSLITLDSKPSM